MFRLQSVLDPAGIQSSRIEQLWWLFFWISVAVFVAVLVYLALAVRRASRAAPSEVPRRITSDASLLRSVAVATGITVVILFGLLITTAFTSRAIARQRNETGMVVRVTAYQWWWDIEYQHTYPSERVRTANELHLPVGRTVALNLVGGSDVIHSFWAPALHGKTDIIPGHDAYLWIRADRPGVYRGQCAEFCGLQHAHMAFTVQVEPSDDFERWVQHQRQTAMPPSSPDAQRGQQLFQQRACVMCHTILGTQAGGSVAPDLTHIAGRPTLAAGTLPNTRENLVAWIGDPQRFKPGTRMPKVELSADELQAIVTYLEALK